LLAAFNGLARCPFPTEQFLDLRVKDLAIVKGGLRRHVLKRKFANHAADAALAYLVCHAAFLPAGEHLVAEGSFFNFRSSYPSGRDRFADRARPSPSGITVLE
jgi:hypothetical protein